MEENTLIKALLKAKIIRQYLPTPSLNTFVSVFRYDMGETPLLAMTGEQFVLPTGLVRIAVARNVEVRARNLKRPGSTQTS